MRRRRQPSPSGLFVLAAGRALAAAALIPACIVEAPTKGQQQQQAATRSAERAPSPPVEIRSGANFGDAIELASLRLSAGRTAPGETLAAVAAFRVTAKLDRDYQIFVHVEDVDGRAERFNVDHAPARGALPTSRWEVGQLVRDDFDITVPPHMAVRGLNVWLGLWDPSTDARLPVKNPDAVRHDGKDRVLVAVVPVIPGA